MDFSGMFGGGGGYSASSAATAGNVSTGTKSFGSTFGSINGGGSIPWYLWAVFALLIVALMLAVVF